MAARNTTVRDKHRAILRKGQPPCHWCGKPIDYQAKYPAPDSYVVDHVIPLAAGGTDTLDNKVPAHQACNRDKSDKPYPNVIRRSGSIRLPGEST